MSYSFNCAHGSGYLALLENQSRISGSQCSEKKLILIKKIVELITQIFKSSTTFGEIIPYRISLKSMEIGVNLFGYLTQRSIETAVANGHTLWE